MAKRVKMSADQHLAYGTQLQGMYKATMQVWCKFPERSLIGRRLKSLMKAIDKVRCPMEDEMFDTGANSEVEKSGVRPLNVYY